MLKIKVYEKCEEHQKQLDINKPAAARFLEDDDDMYSFPSSKMKHTKKSVLPEVAEPAVS